MGGSWEEDSAAETDPIHGLGSDGDASGAAAQSLPDDLSAALNAVDVPEPSAAQETQARHLIIQSICASAMSSTSWP